MRQKCAGCVEKETTLTRLKYRTFLNFLLRNWLPVMLMLKYNVNMCDNYFSKKNQKNLVFLMSIQIADI